MGELPIDCSVEAAAACWPEKVAVTTPSSQLTYAQLWSSVLTLSSSYLELGVIPGDRIVCNLRNRLEFIVAVHAARLCRAVHVGVHNNLTGPELSSLVGRVDARFLVFEARSGLDDPADDLAVVRTEHPHLTAIVHSGRTDRKDRRLAELLSVDVRSCPESVLEGADPDIHFVTSGTTGRPKVAIDTWPSLAAKVACFAEALSPRIGEAHLLFLPMCHAFGLKLALLALSTGGRLVLPERFSPADALRLITQEQVSVLPGTPTHFTLLLNACSTESPPPDQLRWAVSAASPLSPALAARLRKRLGADIFVVYGCSEGFLTTTTDAQDIGLGSVGRNVYRGPPATPPAGSVAVVDIERGTPMPCGTLGEIVFSTQAPVRYWGEDDEAGDGWYRTGDLGRLDDDGRLFVLGRRKELINRGGLKVSPAEIEGELLRHRGIADGAVVPIPDPVLGEAICACVVPSQTGPPALAEVRTFLGGTLARHKLPDQLCLVERLPRTALGKLDRNALRELATATETVREHLRPSSPP